MSRQKKYTDSYVPFDCLGWVDIFNVLKELCISSFKWNNVPDSVNTRFLELSLFDFGKVAFFEDDELGHLALKANLAGRIDVYGEPIKIRVFGSNGYQNQFVNHKTCSIIYNNNVRNTPKHRIEQYARRIYNIERTIDINIYGQRTPLIIKTSKKQQLTLENIMMQYDGYKPIIIVDDGINPNMVSVISTEIPIVFDKLEEEKRKLWNEALSYIGIENNFSEKNERLTQNEVMVSNGLAIANRNAKLKARENAIIEINKMFGLGISVETNNLSYLEFNENEKDVNSIE